MRVFLDTCMLIYAIEDRATRGDAVRQALLALPTPGQFISSEFERFECMVGPTQRDDYATMNEFRELLGDAEFVELRRGLFELATQLRAQRKLKAFDALHVASAIIGNCDELWTNDGRLRIVEDLVRIRILP